MIISGLGHSFVLGTDDITTREPAGQEEESCQGGSGRGRRLSRVQHSLTNTSQPF